MPPRRARGQPRRLSAQQLDEIASGQQSRTVLAVSSERYISKCRVMTRILNSIEDIRSDALQLDENNQPTQHNVCT